MSRGFVSPGVMADYFYRRRNEYYTEDCTLERIDLEVEGPSWSGAVCHSIIGLSLLQSQRCALQGRHPPPHVVLFLQAHPDMTLQHDMSPAILLVLCMIF